MSSKAAKKVDQKEYLKRYLSGDTNKTKKKKVKKHKSKDVAKVKIIDDDAHAATELDIDEELLLTGEDAPQIVGTYVEENPIGVAEVPKWKSIVIKDEDGDEIGYAKQSVKKEEDDLWGPKARSYRVKDEFSPVRKKSKTPDIEPTRKKKDERRRRSRSISKERKKKRKRENGKDRDISPSRRKRENRSPPRDLISCNVNSQRNSIERGRSLSSDQSPPRRRKRDSPPRLSRLNSYDCASSHRRKAEVRNLSPARHRKRDSSTDQSPPRRKRQESFERSPPCRRNRGFSPSLRQAKSTVRIKREKETPDISPVRINSREFESKRERSFSRSIKMEKYEGKRSRWESREVSRSLSPPPTHGKKATKTLDGKQAGLQDAESLKKENQERRLREDEIFAKMSNEMSGRDAEVQVRSDGRHGRRARQAKELNPEEERRKEEHEKKKKEIYDRWGKGLKQIEAHRKKVEEEQYESSKPLARYNNDADLERHLREQERADDPMLEYMRKKNRDKQKDINKPVLPTYEGPYPENRFGIRPGYRWDGVDRSNGYEKKWFAKQNEKRAVQDEAYKYSVDDM